MEKIIKMKVEYSKKYDDFVNYVIENWKEKVTITNEKSTKEFIDIIMYLLSNYRLKCLLGTIINLDDLCEKYFDGDDESGRRRRIRRN